MAELAVGMAAGIISSMFPSEAMATYKLVVEVASAQGLESWINKDSTSYFVELKFDGQRYRTSMKENNPNPVWNERYYFDVWDQSKLPELDIEAYVYLVSSSEKHLKRLLGMVSIAASSCGPCHNAIVILYPLEKKAMWTEKGDLALKVYTTDDPSSISNHFPPANSVISPPGLHVLNSLESILHDPRSRPQGIQLQYLKEITDNFSDERILGQGGFGVVYKGVLPNGEMIAVKKIVSSLLPGLQKQFENDVYHLMMLKHPNIVRCIGYCYETRNECLEYNGQYVFAEMADRLLCLEYLSKGSLDKYISDESSGLNWSTRYNIIEGIGYGLCHLHEQNDKPIIHLDLKPANILLDDNLVPKITDFGLSRLGQLQTICTSSCVGTFGYMAPELLYGGTITSKLDIFSFGVIIMEIITGHRDYPGLAGTSSDEFIELSLQKWRNVLQRSPGHGSLEMDCAQIKRCINAGLICVNPDRTKRPPIAEIIRMIQGLESIDCKTGNEVP